MRPISADLLARIQALNQTIYGNNDPRILATITKVVNDLQVFTVATGDLLGQIDLAMKWTNLALEPEEVWIAEVIYRQAVIQVYTYDKDMDFAAPVKSFSLSSIGTNARVRDIAIEFDGTIINGALQTSGAPYIAWLERTTSYDTCYIIQWDGTGEQPAATELLKVARV